MSTDIKEKREESHNGIHLSESVLNKYQNEYNLDNDHSLDDDKNFLSRYMAGRFNNSFSSSPRSSLKSERTRRVNKTNEFTDSIMARPLWKDELTHETRQSIKYKRMLEKQYESKIYVKDRYTGGFRESTEVSEEKKGLAMKYTEISKSIVINSPKSKDKEEENSFSRRLSYYDNNVKERNYVLVMRERDRAKKAQEEINIKIQEEELKRRQQQEEERRMKQEEYRRRREHIKSLAVFTKAFPTEEKVSIAPVAQVHHVANHKVKIDYPKPKPKLAKLKPQEEAAIQRRQQKEALREKRKKLLEPSKVALDTGFKVYKAPKVLFFKKEQRDLTPKKRIKYIAPSLKKKKKNVQSNSTPTLNETEEAEESEEELVEEESEEESEEEEEEEEEEEVVEEPEVQEVEVQPETPRYEESTKRKYIVSEIVATERTYVSLLREIFELYAEPIQKGNLIPQELYQLVFSDLTVILMLNQQFLEELEATHTEYLRNVEQGIACGLFGTLFQSRAQTFRLYTSYINNYEQSLRIINEQTEKNKAFRQFRKSVSRRLIEIQHNNTDITSYMILPVQRIPRYQLLLKDLVQHTPENHPDYENLKSALNLIVDIAQYCNKKKAEATSTFRVVELAEELRIKDLVQPGRKLVKEGHLCKEKSRNQIHVVLFNDMFIQKEQTPFSQKVTQIPLWSLDTPTVSEETDSSSTYYKLELGISEEDFRLAFYFESKEERDQWANLFISTKKSSRKTDLNEDTPPTSKKRTSRMSFLSNIVEQIFN